jgi:hypothetical protein
MDETPELSKKITITLLLLITPLTAVSGWLF